MVGQSPDFTEHWRQRLATESLQSWGACVDAGETRCIEYIKNFGVMHV